MDKIQLAERLFWQFGICDCGTWQRTDFDGSHLVFCKSHKLADWIWDNFEPRNHLLAQEISNIQATGLCKLLK